MGITTLAGPYHERGGTTAIIDNSMDFCRSPAARAADRLERSAPLSTGRRAMCLGRGAVDHLDATWIGDCQRGELLSADVRAGRGTKEIEDCRRSADNRRRSCMALHLEHVNDTADDLLVAARRASGWFFGNSGAIAAHCPSSSPPPP
ncbi:MAG: hypothetical protein JO001_06215 [Alphaproteobacteria bacterium]|nr:hypothetical protein [Alphaproteobacteria bacterium]